MQSDRQGGALVPSPTAQQQAERITLNPQFMSQVAALNAARTAQAHGPCLLKKDCFTASGLGVDSG